MTTKQRLELRASEIRTRLNEIAGLEGDAFTDAVRTESDKLTNEYRDVETRIRAATIAEDAEADAKTTDTTDPETRERLELRNKAAVGRFLAAALAGRIPDGAEAEYGAACGAVPGAVPLEIFEMDRPRPETRAAGDAVTPAPASGTGATLAPIQPFVFAPSIAARLGIAMPSVGSGAYSEGRISTALTAAAKSKGDAQASTAAVVTPTTASPRRLSARLSIAAEDVALIGQANFEAALRQNVSMALSAEYDKQCINGDGTSPNISGLIAQLTNPTDPTAVADFDAFLAAFADQIDGLWSARLSEVAIVANVDAYKLSARSFRDLGVTVRNAADDDNVGGYGSRGAVSFADYAAEHTGGWWTNSRMPATASNIARGIVHRMGRTGMRTAVHPTWGTLSIDDIYTDAASATRHFSLHVLVGDKVLLVQPAAYGLVEFKVA